MYEAGAINAEASVAVAKGGKATPLLVMIGCYDHAPNRLGRLLIDR